MSSSQITAKVNTTDFNVVPYPLSTSGDRYIPSVLLFLLVIGAPNRTIKDYRLLGLKLLR